MEKKHFLYKLYPLSPTFYSDQNVEEKQIMQQHTQYWMELKDKTKIIVYGSVFEAKGVYGMVVIEVENDEEANYIAKHDPAVSSKVCTYELTPMLVGIAQK